MATDPAPEPELATRKLLIAYFPRCATSDDLRGAFAKHARVQAARVVRDGDGDSRCYGFVDFHNAHETRLALEACEKGDVQLTDDTGKTWYLKGEYAHCKQTKRSRGGRAGGKQTSSTGPTRTQPAGDVGSSEDDMFGDLANKHPSESEDYDSRDGYNSAERRFADEYHYIYDDPSFRVPRDHIGDPRDRRMTGRRTSKDQRNIHISKAKHADGGPHRYISEDEYVRLRQIELDYCRAQQRKRLVEQGNYSPPGYIHEGDHRGIPRGRYISQYGHYTEYIPKRDDFDDPQSIYRHGDRAILYHTGAVENFHNSGIPVPRDCYFPDSRRACNPQEGNADNQYLMCVPVSRGHYVREPRHQPPSEGNQYGYAGNVGHVQNMSIPISDSFRKQDSFEDVLRTDPRAQYISRQDNIETSQCHYLGGSPTMAAWVQAPTSPKPFSGHPRNQHISESFVYSNCDDNYGAQVLRSDFGDDGQNKIEETTPHDDTISYQRYSL